jgi:predicted hotdog family 3-hydroxylacyl-ACP dehydratase
MKPEDYNIIDLIPQRPPMVLIDRLVYSDGISAIGRLFIRDTNLFSGNGVLQEGGIIEFIAQTCAAFAGYRQLVLHKDVQTGFIGAIKNLEVHSLPEINTEIQSEIIVENELLGYTIITGKIVQNNLVIAECEMRILTDNQSVK